MHRFGRRFGRAAVVLAAAVFVAAGLGATSSDAVLDVATENVTQERENVAQATACKQSGTLRYGIAGGGISNLDANIDNLLSHLVYYPLLFPALTAITRDGTVRPDLATKWKSSPDLKTWWFYLRRDVRYANGRQFTSADVVANVRRALDPTVGAGATAFISDIRSVRAITKYQVRFKMGSPNAILPDALFLVKMTDTRNVAKLATSGNGTGPYKVASYVPNQRLTLVPNPYYFGPKPCLKQISIVSQPDTTSMVTAFTSNKLDMIWQVPVTAVSTIRAAKNAVIIRPKFASTAHVLTVDMVSPPFDNVLARRALSHAMNRNAMVKAGFLGRASASIANSLLSRESRAYNRKLAPQTFNLAKAKQLFTQAGVEPGTTFTYWAQAGKRDEWITMGAILQQDLQKIGLNLNIVRADPATWLAKFAPVGKRYPGLIVATFFGLDPNPTLGLSRPLAGKCACNWNQLGGQYPKYESFVQKALGTTDPTKRQAIYDQLQQLFSQEVPLMVIAHQTNIVAAQKSVVGAWEDPTGNMHLENARLVR